MSANVEAGVRACVCLFLCASTVAAINSRAAPTPLLANNSDIVSLEVGSWDGELERIGAMESAGAEANETLAKGSCFKQGFTESHPTKPLEFVHIPRNAGTSVEMCSMIDTSRPKEQKWGVQNPNIQGLYKMPKPANWKTPWPPACYKQHVPPAYLPQVYGGKETFCVVRDPYARMVSQFKFVAIHFKVGLENGQCTAAVMNSALLIHLKKARDENPYFGDCHYLPQAVFVFDIDPSTAKTRYRQRSCKNVLRLENFQNDFGSLMEQHGYPYELLPNNKAGGTLGPGSCEGRNKNELSFEVRRLIEEMYEDDFKHFNYEKMQ